MVHLCLGGKTDLIFERLGWVLCLEMWVQKCREDDLLVVWDKGMSREYVGFFLLEES